MGLTEPQIYGFLDTQNDWIYEEGKLWAKYEFESFLEAIAFVNDIAEVTENMWYYPMISIDRYMVTLHIWIGHEYDLTEQDIELVKNIVDLLD